MMNMDEREKEYGKDGAIGLGAAISGTLSQKSFELVSDETIAAAHHKWSAYLAAQKFWSGAKVTGLLAAAACVAVAIGLGLQQEGNNVTIPPEAPPTAAFTDHSAGSVYFPGGTREDYFVSPASIELRGLTSPYDSVVWEVQDADGAAVASGEGLSADSALPSLAPGDYRVDFTITYGDGTVVHKTRDFIIK